MQRHGTGSGNNHAPNYDLKLLYSFLFLSSLNETSSETFSSLPENRRSKPSYGYLSGSFFAQISAIDIDIVDDGGFWVAEGCASRGQPDVALEH